MPATIMTIYQKLILIFNHVASNDIRYICTKANNKFESTSSSFHLAMPYYRSFPVLLYPLFPCSSVFPYLLCSPVFLYLPYSSISCVLLYAPIFSVPSSTCSLCNGGCPAEPFLPHNYCTQPHSGSPVFQN